jgi:alanine-glyoxylate transaminase/serine-glyoxylate transaminase/serine-pyruvate transaminase
MTSKFNLPVRKLLGPGPANVDPRVMEAMHAPAIGHMDPAFMEVLAETADLLRYAFGTENDVTMAVSGTGFSGLDMALSNALEPGDRIVVGISGFFGEKAAEIATRLGAEAIKVSNGFGKPVAPETVQAAVAGAGRVKAVFLVAAETSVGLRQPIAEIAEIAHKSDALMIADTVTLLGGAKMELDEWGVDIAYAGSQKCVGAVAGTAPITFSPRAVEAIKQRSKPVPSWYLDALALHRYWSNEPFYHHTCPSTLMMGLREALRIVHEETIEARADRHDRNGRALVAGLEAMGLEVASDPKHRLGMLTPVRIPEGISDAAVRGELLRRHDIEIGGGLGNWAGKVWRIGLMGVGSNLANVLVILGALEELLSEEGHGLEPGAAAAAAKRIVTPA